jgi:hypothetical protein
MTTAKPVSTIRTLPPPAPPVERRQVVVGRICASKIQMLVDATWMAQQVAR